jgi:hypothetical protein
MFGIVDGYAQGISPPKAGGLLNDPSPIKLIVEPTDTPGAGIFVAPSQGRYQFVLQGAGGTGNNGGGPATGGPGALALRVVRLAKGQRIPYTVSHGGYLHAPARVDSSVTFGDRIMIAGRGGDALDDVTYGAGGIASGGDININGVTGSIQAPSYGPFLGGTRGQDATPTSAPGGPGNYIGSGGGPNEGAAGRLTVTFLGP